MPTIPLTLIEAGRYWTPAELTAIPTVALTEDDDDPCEIVQRHLEALGYRVLAVASIGLHATAEIASTEAVRYFGHDERRVSSTTIASSSPPAGRSASPSGAAASTVASRTDMRPRTVAMDAAPAPPSSTPAPRRPHDNVPPVTGPDGNNPMTRSQVRTLRDSFDEADDPDLALACDRALGLDYPGDESDEYCWPGIVETSWETCAAAYNARAKETP